MQRLDFKTNWNNKLNCAAFTTFRIHNPDKYRVGAVLAVYLRDKFMFEAEVIDTRDMYLYQVSDFVAYIDTGYDVQQFKQIVRTIYKNNVNPDAMLFQLVLLKRRGKL